MSARHSASEISALLAERMEQLATDLIGVAPTYRHGDTIRFRAKGSLVVEVRGARCGIWCDHGASGVGGDALDLVRHVRNCSMPDALDFAAAWLGLRPGQTTRPAPPPKPSPASDNPARAAEMAQRLWCEAVDPDCGPVPVYLASRGLLLPGAPVIRFHPSCPRGVERLPAMLALMTDPETGQPIGVHRTFLKLNGSGKANGQAKMMLGRAGVIRLAGATGGRLGIAEGIETSLSLMQVEAWSPVWAAGSAGGIARLPVLPDIQHLTIFPDADDSGASIAASRTCARRWSDAGRHVSIEVPPAGTDWADVAREHGL